MEHPRTKRPGRCILDSREAASRGRVARVRGPAGKEGRKEKGPGPAGASRGHCANAGEPGPRRALPPAAPPAAGRGVPRYSRRGREGVRAAAVSPPCGPGDTVPVSAASGAFAFG